jgi:hypothetical protein
VKNITVFFGRPPDQANAEDLRRRHLHLASAGTTTPKMSAAVRRAALLLQRDARTSPSGCRLCTSRASCQWC